MTTYELLTIVLVVLDILVSLFAIIITLLIEFIKAKK